MLARPRSAYVHVPFCRHRCGYCNFSVVARRDDLIERYLAAIDSELAKNSVQRPALETLFVGGGTPTHLSTQQLERFLTIMRSRFDLESMVEWSIEANPEDITDDKLSLLASFGVNRISLGIQSFDDEKLHVLERGHRGDSAQQVVQQVAEQIPNVSIDLIFAAPGESLEDWKRDLDTATSLPIQHISTYALTFEKGTSFWSRRLRGDLFSARETDEIAMYDLARKVLGDAGLAHYEISNFSAAGHRCRHNLAYWGGAGWYAAGPGAAAFIDSVRTVNHRSTTTYLKRIEAGENPIAESDPINDEQLAREKAAFGIRMIDGVNLDEIHASTNVDLGTLCAPELEQLTKQNMIVRGDAHIRLTTHGIHFADSVAAAFLG